MHNMNEIREMLKMLKDSSIQKLELETTRIVIVKNDQVPTGPEVSKLDAPLPERMDERAACDPAADPPPISSKQDGKPLLREIVSPMVGTFYSAPEPGEPPFVTVGKKIMPTTVVCVVEAMKLLNEIDAGVQGEIAEILAKDGEFVQYNQPLFLVREGG